MKFIRHVPTHELPWAVIDTIDFAKAVSCHRTIEEAVKSLYDPMAYSTLFTQDSRPISDKDLVQVKKALMPYLLDQHSVEADARALLMMKLILRVEDLKAQLNSGARPAPESNNQPGKENQMPKPEKKQHKHGPHADDAYGDNGKVDQQKAVAGARKWADEIESGNAEIVAMSEMPLTDGLTVLTFVRRDKN